MLFQTTPDPYDLTAVLVWLASGLGGPTLVGMLFAILVEYVPAWHTVKRMYKFLIGIGLSVLLAFGANWLLNQPGLVEQIEPIFVTVLTVIAGMLSWLGQQYGLAKAERDGLNTTAKSLAKSPKHR